MTYTCSIQKVDFFIDQFEEIGQVNLEQAIDIFQNFPFLDQFREARERDLSSCLPTILFDSPNGEIFKIWAEDDSGFFLHYDNGRQVSDFYLSNDFERNPEGLAVEEFIDLFFNNTIEDELNLVEKVVEEENDELADSFDRISSSNVVTFSFDHNQKFKLYLWTIPWLAIALIFLKFDAGRNFEYGWSLHLFFSIFWLPSSIVHLSYWFKNNGAVVSIDTKSKTLSYKKGGQLIKFNREDIINCEINEARSSKAPWNSYSYIWFVLKDKRQVVISNFITQPENIINEFKPNFKVEKRTIPFLPI